MLRYRIHEIDPERDLPTLHAKVLRLPEWRRRKVLSYIHAIDRLQSALAYDLIADLLLQECGLLPDAFEMRYDELGKPFLIHSTTGGHPHSEKPIEGIYISLSHCEQAVMAVVSDKPVGCDTEGIPGSDDFHDIMDYCYTDGERHAVESAATPAAEFTRIWTAKEALFKLDNTLLLEHLDTIHLPTGQIKSLHFPFFIASIASI